MSVHISIDLDPVEVPVPPQPPADENVPEPVPEADILDSTIAYPWQTFGLLRLDIARDEHSGKLPQTNDTWPNRPVDDTGRVSPNGKEIVHIEHSPWAYWLLELSGGPENFAKIATPGDGFMDTIGILALLDYFVRVNTYRLAQMAQRIYGRVAGLTGFDVESYDNLPLLSCPTAAQLVRITGEILQGGAWYYLIETLDFHQPPEQVDGVWLYRGQAITPKNSPHLFYARVNRVWTSIVTWLTSYGLMAANDGGVSGGKGEEYRPAIAIHQVAQPRSLVRLYPEAGTKVRIYKNSLIVDGDLVPQAGGRTITIRAYRYQWSNTYIQADETGEWFKADEMLVRANADVRAPGNSLDYRCYVSLLDENGDPEGSPYMGHLHHRVPRSGWVGLRGDFHLLDP